MVEAAAARSHRGDPPVFCSARASRSSKDRPRRSRLTRRSEKRRTRSGARWCEPGVHRIVAVSGRAVRRVVTGTIDGRSHVVRDDLVQAVTVAPLPGYAWHRLWGLDEPPGDPPRTELERQLAHFPPPGGLRYHVYTVPPQHSQSSSTTLSAEEERELEEQLPGR